MMRGSLGTGADRENDRFCHNETSPKRIELFSKRKKGLKHKV